jgi:D-alanyl-D-alanine carboxypeptidase/D-alanyl-D-alanine-endopeptidase (penicillin-binding protein 4)
MVLGAVCLAAAVASSLPWGPSAAQPAGEPTPQGQSLVARLRGLVDEAGLGDKLGICVRDARTGREIFSHHKKLALNPASNMKLVTAAAALQELGPEFRMSTGLYGKIEDDGHVPWLVLRGHGDPTLRMSDLVELAEQLADKGVGRVDTVAVDGSYFDDQVLPPAFEQQPDEVASFRAPVAAVAVEHGAYTLRVLPGDEAGEPASVRLAAEGYFAVENSIETSKGGGPDVVAIQRAKEEQMELILRGSVPAGILGVSYRRRVEQPLWHAGHAMVEALKRAGIRTGGDVQVGKRPNGLPLITARKSPPLSKILLQLGKHSDNFVAETLLKVLGAERKEPGTSKRGTQVLEETLKAAGVDPGRTTIINGSGLFEGNAIAADHLAKLLVHMYRDPTVRSDYLSQLAIGGVDGTLHRRLEGTAAERMVRAKTGTLDEVIALTGYVLGPEPERAYAFSVLVNDAYGKHAKSRDLADDLVTELATHLN